MTQWHVWEQGSTSPTVIEDSVTLSAYLQTLTGTVVVNRYDNVHSSTVVYNAPGGSPLPSPPDPLPTIVSTQVTHLKRQ